MLDLIIYKDGMWFRNGPLRQWNLKIAKDFIKDIMDGFFPYELKEEYPDGISIAAELVLPAAKNFDDIARIRRGFARRNHPDKLHPRLAELATARMKTANMLIDRRSRELKPRG